MSSWFNPRGVPGIVWREPGQASIGLQWSGWMDDFDRAVEAAAVGAQHAQPWRFPSFVPATSLARMGYFTSFPHLATFATSLDPAEANVRAFAGAPLCGDAVQLTQTIAPQVLTPAACYHVYESQRGSAFDAPRHFTTRCRCYRRETEYVPLARQWCFEMREVVCVGSRDATTEHLAAWRRRIDELAHRLELPIRWEQAADPFFDPASSPGLAWQKLAPVKMEAVYGPPESPLALASLNLHHEAFGDAFDLRVGGATAATACAAFGLERWLLAMFTTHGPDAWPWPEPRL